MTDAGPFVQAVYGREIEKKKEERGGRHRYFVFTCAD
jgi:hypothetical protein